MSGAWSDIDARRLAHEEALRATKSAIDSIPALGGKWTFRGVSSLGKWRATHRHKDPIEARSGTELVELVRAAESQKKQGAGNG